MKLRKILFGVCVAATPVCAKDLFLIKHPYPPLPNMLEDAKTIKGVDNDNNGMRDLLDREIIEIVDLSCKSERVKESAYKQLFHLFEMMKPTNKVIDLWAVKDGWQKLPCGIGDGDYESFYITFEPTVDTDDRLDLAESHALKSNPKSLCSDQM